MSGTFIRYSDFALCEVSSQYPAPVCRSCLHHGGLNTRGRVIDNHLCGGVESGVASWTQNILLPFNDDLLAGHLTRGSSLSVGEAGMPPSRAPPSLLALQVHWQHVASPGPLICTHGHQWNQGVAAESEVAYQILPQSRREHGLCLDLSTSNWDYQQVPSLPATASHKAWSASDDFEGSVQNQRSSSVASQPASITPLRLESCGFPTVSSFSEDTFDWTPLSQDKTALASSIVPVPFDEIQLESFNDLELDLFDSPAAGGSSTSTSSQPDSTSIMFPETQGFHTCMPPVDLSAHSTWSAEYKPLRPTASATSSNNSENSAVSPLPALEHTQTVSAESPIPPKKKDGLKEITKLKTFQCDHCPRVFTSQASLRRHLDRVIKLYKCPDPNCDFAAAVLRDITRHMATRKHLREAGEIPVVNNSCPIKGCRYSSHRPDNFARHIRKRHGRGVTTSLGPAGGQSSEEAVDEEDVSE